MYVQLKIICKYKASSALPLGLLFYFYYVMRGRVTRETPTTARGTRKYRIHTYTHTHTHTHTHTQKVYRQRQRCEVKLLRPKICCICLRYTHEISPLL